MSAPGSQAMYISELLRQASERHRRHAERNRVMAEIRQMDDHTLRQFGLSRIDLIAIPSFLAHPKDTGVQ